MSAATDNLKAAQAYARSHGGLYRAAMHGQEAIKALANGDEAKSNLHLGLMAVEVCRVQQHFPVPGAPLAVLGLSDQQRKDAVVEATT